MTTTHRRTVAEMEARLARARALLEARATEERAEYERYRERGNHADGAFSHGAACGLEQALQMLEWAFSAERDWMYR